MMDLLWTMAEQQCAREDLYVSGIENNLDIFWKEVGIRRQEL